MASSTNCATPKRAFQMAGSCPLCSTGHKQVCIWSCTRIVPVVQSCTLFIAFLLQICSFTKTLSVIDSIAQASTLLRVIQREDYKNRKKRLAPLPTAYDKTSTGSYEVSFCSLSQYNLRHRGDFWISLPFLRNSTPNIGGGHPLGGQEIRLLKWIYLERRRNSKFASVA